jgi:hypothetical protein
MPANYEFSPPPKAMNASIGPELKTKQAVAILERQDNEGARYTH